MIELLINLFPSLAEKLASYFGKITFNVSKVEMKLDKPKEPDGDGGFNHGSYGNFTLEIINKKGVDVILEDVQEIFDTAELIANLDRNAVKVEHSVYDYIVYDSSTVERPFALALDNDPDVKMFFKIPDRFKIDTPIGAYNPDWAVYLTKNGEEKLYFILETKGSDSFMDLRTREQLKIHCGKKHFEALENGIEMQVATDWHEIKARV